MKYLKPLVPAGKNATAVIWKMLLVAERAFRRVKHPEVMSLVYQGAGFEDG